MIKMNICSDLQDTMKAVPGRKLIALSAYTKKKFGKISYQQLNLTPESSRTKRGKGTQEEQSAGNNQTEG